MTIPQKYEVEVIELHQFFQDWFNGVLTDTPAAFARFAEVMAPAFVIVMPDGRAIPREPLLSGLAQAYGSWQTRGHGRIEIKNFEVRQTLADGVIATYEEWQVIEGQETARLSTVVFGHQPALKNGVVWRHVHETWLTPAS